MQQNFLNIIQKGFPVAKRPFKLLSQKLQSSEEEVLNLYKKLKNDKIIRQTSAIFDTKSLDYKSSLVAFKTDSIEDVAKFVNTHPGVSHNYERDHEFNLWFTIAVAPDSKIGLEKTIELLAQKTRTKEYIVLPTKKMFKISVMLDMKGDQEKKEKVKKQKHKAIKLEPFDIEIIKLLQKDIEPLYEPFEHIVNSLDITYDKLLEKVNKFQESGVLRRFASILYHRKAGFRANAMVVWNVDEDDAEEIGQKIASYKAVSHCYLRPVFPNWQYPLFSMMHAKSKEEIDEIVRDIVDELGIKKYQYLYSLREFKKQRIKYFSQEFEEWESKNYKN